MSSRRFIRIPEIQNLVFVYQDLPTLAALAVTCKDFTENALDSLWQYQNSLSPLIKTMSAEGDLWVNGYEHMSGNDGTLNLVTSVMKLGREIERRDWKRYHCYAPRIRHLHLTSSDRIHVELLSALCAYRPNQTILPRLKSISMKVTSTIQSLNIVQYIPYFIGSSVRSFSLSEGTMASSGPLVSLISSIPDLCPHLARFEKTCEGDDSRDPELLEYLVLELEELESLKCQGLGLTPRLVKHLGNLSTFREWDEVIPDILVNNVKSGASLSTCFAGRPFRTLDSIQITTFSFAATTQLLDLLQSPLRKLAIRLSNQVPFISTHSFLPLCITITTFEYLHHLSIDGNIYDQTLLDRASARTAISPLLSLKHLQIFRITTPVIFSLDDHFLLEIPEAWPNLTYLEMSSASNRQELLVSAVTLQGLVPLSQRCLKLKTLKISCQCRPFDDRSLQLDKNTSLHILHLVKSDIEPDHELPVLRCIHSLFPNATDVKAVTYTASERRIWAAFNRAAHQFYAGA